MQILEFDTLIVGSGLAGLSAAYHSSNHGSVAIVTKSELDISNSYYAQGGIAAAIASDDTPATHMHDTLVAGRRMCDRDAVRILVNEGKERVLELIEMGMPFDKVDGKITLGLEGGHSKRRILHAGGDATGKELTSFFLKKIQDKNNIQAFEYTAVVRLLKKGNCITGVQAIDFISGKNVIFRAKAVILSTGGLSRVYSRTTNPHTATGDGIALAYEAGARIADLEFIQFHPSALYIPNQDAFLISEAVRGEGAWLLNEEGKRFMVDIHPLAELAPRDIVAFAIYNQIKKSESKVVYLSLAHLDAEKIKNRFKTIYTKLQEYNFDLCKDLLPVAPAAHYMVGGIRTGLEGETNIEGLFVCGEAASTGVMGANRLASNSLLECLVFGKRCSDKAAQLNEIDCDLQKEFEPMLINPENENFFLERKNEIAYLMSENVGIVRTKPKLQAALTRLEELDKELFGYEDEYNKHKVKNLLQVSMLITRSAIIREESRGVHIRGDFQKQNTDYKEHIIQQKDKEIIFEPIRT